MRLIKLWIVVLAACSSDAPDTDLNTIDGDDIRCPCNTEAEPPDVCIEHRREEPAYADADNDGFGDPTTEVYDCSDVGVVSNASDCDDQSAAVNPQAVEDCTDGIDNNCDGAVDEADAACGS